MLFLFLVRCFFFLIALCFVFLLHYPLSSKNHSKLFSNSFFNDGILGCLSNVRIFLISHTIGVIILYFFAYFPRFIQTSFMNYAYFTYFKFLVSLNMWFMVAFFFFVEVLLYFFAVCFVTLDGILSYFFLILSFSSMASFTAATRVWKHQMIRSVRHWEDFILNSQFSQIDLIVTQWLPFLFFKAATCLFLALIIIDLFILFWWQYNRILP